jgi:hypothetical protein
VAKKNKSYRMVVDYRKLNLITQSEAQVLPTIEESFELIGRNNPTYFSSFDIQSGFFQVPISPKSRPFTAFRCYRGQFQFKILAMGLKNSAVTFQRVMEAVLKGLQWKSCIVYIDDIVTMGQTFEELLLNTRAVFFSLRKAGLKLRPEKCNLGF